MSTDSSPVIEIKSMSSPLTLPKIPVSIAFLAIALLPLGFLLRIWIRGILNATKARYVYVHGM